MEALEAFGWETLREVGEEGAARLAASRSAAGDALRDRRQQLGLEARQVPAAAWEAAERYTVDYHPLRSVRAWTVPAAARR